MYYGTFYQNHTRYTIHIDDIMRTQIVQNLHLVSLIISAFQRNFGQLDWDQTKIEIR